MKMRAAKLVVIVVSLILVAVKITPAAVVTIVAGQGRRGSADGRGLAAGFNCPGDIACDAAGDLFVADTNNATIRKISWSH